MMPLCLHMEFGPLEADALFPTDESCRPQDPPVDPRLAELVRNFLFDAHGVVVYASEIRFVIPDLSPYIYGGRHLDEPRNLLTAVRHPRDDWQWIGYALCNLASVAGRVIPIRVDFVCVM